jgi:hypothetical protein
VNGRGGSGGHEASPAQFGAYLTKRDAYLAQTSNFFLLLPSFGNQLDSDRLKGADLSSLPHLAKRPFANDVQHTVCTEQFAGCNAHLCSQTRRKLVPELSRNTIRRPKRLNTSAPTESAPKLDFPLAEEGWLDGTTAPQRSVISLSCLLRIEGGRGLEEVVDKSE